MKTNVVMDSVDREFMGSNIRQRTKDEYFSLRDVIEAINRHRIANRKEPVVAHRYFNLPSSKEFIRLLRADIGHEVFYKETRRTQGWIHPYLMIDILLHFEPEIKIKVYKWLYDYLIKNRIKSADSFIQMKGALYEYYPNKAKYPGFLMGVAKKIKEEIGVSDWNVATEKELGEREFLQNLIMSLTLTMRNAKQGIDLAFDAFRQRKLGLIKF